jgi:hypothetical protein
VAGVVFLISLACPPLLLLISISRQFPLLSSSHRSLDVGDFPLSCRPCSTCFVLWHLHLATLDMSLVCAAALRLLTCVSAPFPFETKAAATGQARTPTLTHLTHAVPDSPSSPQGLVGELVLADVQRDRLLGEVSRRFQPAATFSRRLSLADLITPLSTYTHLKGHGPATCRRLSPRPCCHV